MFVQPTHFLVEAGREPWGTEHPLLRSPSVGISQRDLCSAALELFWRVCGWLGLSCACDIWAFSVSKMAQFNGKTMLVTEDMLFFEIQCLLMHSLISHIVHGVSSSLLSSVRDLVCLSKALTDGQPCMLQSLDFLPVYFFNTNVKQFVCDVLNLWDLQLYRFMNTNGTLSVLGVY